MVRFSNFTLKKEIYEKFDEFLSKLVWRETLFKIGMVHSYYKKM